MLRPLPDDPLELTELRDELTISIRHHRQVVSLASSYLRQLALAHDADQSGPDAAVKGLVDQFTQLAQDYGDLACNEARARAETTVRRGLMEFLNDVDQARYMQVQAQTMHIFRTVATLADEYRAAKAFEPVAELFAKLALKKLDERRRTAQEQGISTPDPSPEDDDEEDDDEPTPEDIYSELLQQGEAFMTCGEAVIELQESLRRDVQQRLTSHSNSPAVAVGPGSAPANPSIAPPTSSEWGRMTCNQRMFSVLAGDRETYQHSAVWWADKVGFDASTVKKTDAWDAIQTERAREQQRRRGT